MDLLGFPLPSGAGNEVAEGGTQGRAAPPKGPKPPGWPCAVLARRPWHVRERAQGLREPFATGSVHHQSTEEGLVQWI